MSRRTGGPTLTVISWRDIPAQVTARSPSGTARTELPAAFAVAIDRAAMKAGLQGPDDYLDEWKRVSRPCGDALEEEVAAEVERIVADFPAARLATLADRLGIDDDSDNQREDE
jgi:hypothetical protein